MYTHCGNERALGVAENMARWVGNWTRPLGEEHMQRVLNVEHGGMMEVLCDLSAARRRDCLVEHFPDSAVVVVAATRSVHVPVRVMPLALCKPVAAVVRVDVSVRNHQVQVPVMSMETARHHDAGHRDQPRHHPVLHIGLLFSCFLLFL